MIRANKPQMLKALCMFIALLLGGNLSAHATESSRFSQKLDALKPEVKQDILLNIERYWLIKTSEKMQAHGFSQNDIAKVIYGPAFEQFISRVLNDRNTQKAIDRYIDQTLNEQNLLQHAQAIQARAHQKQLEEYKDMLRSMAQLRKQQDIQKSKKPWYKVFFSRFELFE